MSETLFAEPTTAVATQVVQPLAVVEASPIAVIQRIAESGGDPNAWMQLLREWEDRIAAENYGFAVAKFQAKCPQIQKLRTVDFGGGKGPVYASLDDIMAVVKPILAECGLAVSFTAGMTDDGKLTAKCIVRHGRHCEESAITLPVPTQLRVNDSQRLGAALSYAKRYALTCALNIVVSDEDRDGVGLCDTIGEADIATLREWIANTNSNEAKYLQTLGVDSFAAIPQRDFAKALQLLKDKAARQR